jgi:hypothetical protein
MLWLLTGLMVLIVAVAGGASLSGAVTAAAALGGVPDQTIVPIAVGTLLIGFAAFLVAGVRDLAMLARSGAASLPHRWLVGSIMALPVAGPFWSLCVVQIQESISGSDAVRLAFDNVMYALVLGFVLPLAVGVPVMLMRLRAIHHGVTEGMSGAKP